MQIKTERLELIPLTVDQLVMWNDDITSLENQLGYEYDGEIINMQMHDIINNQIFVLKNHADDYLYNSFFLIAVREIRVIVGSIGFKGTPNINGEVEIGYGLAKHHEHCGYMTESVRAICEWALSQNGVDSVIAETNIYNNASQQVLLRCGFKQYKQAGTMWWRI